MQSAFACERALTLATGFSQISLASPELGHAIFQLHLTSLPATSHPLRRECGGPELLDLRRLLTQLSVHRCDLGLQVRASPCLCIPAFLDKLGDAFDTATARGGTRRCQRKIAIDVLACGSFWCHNMVSVVSYLSIPSALLLIVPAIARGHERLQCLNLRLLPGQLVLFCKELCLQCLTIIFSSSSQALADGLDAHCLLLQLLVSRAELRLAQCYAANHPGAKLLDPR
mmetsp:Transcript_123153/g.353800  ORF Transcript_123153/g.353800 Transcript_123153/m.353800 type:complete len:228 (+) Transcript_123153:1433-2116(+)